LSGVAAYIFAAVRVVDDMVRSKNAESIPNPAPTPSAHATIPDEAARTRMETNLSGAYRA
jgi:hypothetical protein